MSLWQRSRPVTERRNCRHISESCPSICKPLQMPKTFRHSNADLHTTAGSNFNDRVGGQLFSVLNVHLGGRGIMVTAPMQGRKFAKLKITLIKTNSGLFCVPRPWKIEWVNGWYYASAQHCELEFATMKLQSQVWLHFEGKGVCYRARIICFQETSLVFWTYKICSDITVGYA